MKDNNVSNFGSIRFVAWYKYLFFIQTEEKNNAFLNLIMGGSATQLRNQLNIYAGIIGKK